jgi:hypothetical protein
MLTLLRILATLVLMLGTAAPSFAVGGQPPLNDKPYNYGQCVKAGYVNPQDDIAGPFTVNKNNANFAPGQAEKHGYGIGCPHPDSV